MEKKLTTQKMKNLLKKKNQRKRKENLSLYALLLLSLLELPYLLRKMS